MLACLLLWPSFQAVGQAKPGNAIATVKRFLALRAQGKEAEARAMLAPDARIWFEERQGDGAPWTFPGRWTHWDDYFNGQISYANWRQAGNQVTADGREINDFYRLIERPRQSFQASWWLDEQGRLTGFLFKPIRRPGANRDRLDEVKLWAKQRRPAELEYLMPNGEIDPTGDRAQRWQVMLVEWRKFAIAQGSSAKVEAQGQDHILPYTQSTSFIA